MSTDRLGLASFVLQSRAKKIITVLNTTQILTVKQEIKRMLDEVSRTEALGRKVQVGIMRAGLSCLEASYYIT